MKDAIQDVSTFHDIFGLPIADEPTQVSRQQMMLRLDLLDEEFCEYRAAALSGDLVGIADALADVIYVAIGTALVYGIPLELVWNAVQTSNLNKAGKCETCESWGVDEYNQPCETCGGNGFLVTKRNDGKVLKPEGWKAPNIAAILKKAAKEHHAS